MSSRSDVAATVSDRSERRCCGDAGAPEGLMIDLRFVELGVSVDAATAEPAYDCLSLCSSSDPALRADDDLGVTAATFELSWFAPERTPIAASFLEKRVLRFIDPWCLDNDVSCHR